RLALGRRALGRRPARAGLSDPSLASGGVFRAGGGRPAGMVRTVAPRGRAGDAGRIRRAPRGGHPGHHPLDLRRAGSDRPPRTPGRAADRSPRSGDPAPSVGRGASVRLGGPPSPGERVVAAVLPGGLETKRLALGAPVTGIGPWGTPTLDEHSL